MGGAAERVGAGLDGTATAHLSADERCQESQDDASPAPAYPYRVAIGGITGTFHVVEGLGRAPEAVDFREGGDPTFAAQTMPQLSTSGNVTLLEGLFANDAGFWNWYDQISMNTAAPQTVVITLDPAGAAGTTWTVTGALPTRISGVEP